jgi:ParB family transcriptional regulator, chromosome partitioning protein
MTDQDERLIALVKNTQRENLNSIEETEAILDLLSLELNLHRSEVTTLLHKLKNQGGDDVISKVENVFAGLINMSWLSFVQNRLPLLNLPEELLEVLHQGKIDYTKARAIGQVKNQDARKALLTEAIKNDLSLVDIRERVDASKKRAKSAGDLETRFNDLYKRAKKAKLADDPKKKQELEEVLNILEQLLDSPTLN